MFVDSDAHVDECWDTWSYFPKTGTAARFRPAEMDFVPEQIPDYLSAERWIDGVPARGLFVGGQVFYKRNRTVEQSATTKEARELRDVPGRLKHMDELGIQTQILYPSALLTEMSDRADVEIAICQAYNRWLADRCSEGEGRLRWNASLPMRSIPDALKEMRRVKKDGAVGIVMRGLHDDRRTLGEEYFHPVYELAQELDLPITIHAAHPYTVGIYGGISGKSTLRGGLYAQDAFLSLMLSGTPAKFPRLRFGIIEAASGWVPWALYTARYQYAHVTGAGNADVRSKVEKLPYAEILEENRMYITCESPEDLPTIIGQLGDNNLLLGTDYGHTDRSAILHGHQEVIDRTDISKESATKITETNARNLWGV